MYRQIASVSKRATLFILVLWLSGSPLHIDKLLALQYTEPFECRDLLVVFNRGSGQNRENKFTGNPFNVNFQSVEPESYSFFNWFKTHLDVEYPNVDYKAVSVHDFPGKYEPIGYTAAGVGLQEIANSTNAEASWAPGDYRASVEHGTAETVGYLKDQIADCPDQSIVVGGYSQGAQVMGDSLFQLTPAERSKILGVGFVGDPKFIASTDGLLNPFDKTVSYPWRRGDATNKDRGMLDARVPYLPSDMEKKTTSWCMRMDIICSGWSGVNKDFRVAHGSYAAEPMRNTVNEIMQWAAPKLAEAERARGGFSTTSGPTNPTTLTDNKMRDVMFLLNDDGLDKALYSFRYDTDLVMSPINGKFPNTNYAVKGFGEGQDGTTQLPRVNNIQSFLPYTGYNPNQPATSTSNLYRSIASRYPFGQPQMGGGDFADPHGLAVEKASLSGGWRPEAEKHIILVTDRAPKEDYSYNICHSTVRSWLQIPKTSGYDACFLKSFIDTWPKVQHSEICETIYMALTQDNCANPIKQPGYTQFINRSLNDGIIAAQSQHIAIDVVIPYKVTNQHHPEVITKMQSDLEYLAKSTGGKFIYYDQRAQFDKATYSDMMHQILGHTPKDLVLAYKEALNGRDEFNRNKVLGASTNTPVILDASQSNTSFSTYKWDLNNDGQWDETSPGPVIEHEFTNPQTGFVRIAGVSENGIIEAETRMPVSVSTPTEPPNLSEPPAIPSVMSATESDGKINLTWESAEQGTLVVIDPESHLPVAVAPLTDGAINFVPERPYSKLQIAVFNNSAASEVSTINVVPVPPVLEVIDSPIPPEQETAIVVDLPVSEELPIVEKTPDPTLCYKLQQCTSESSPEVQHHNSESFIIQTAAAPPEQPIVVGLEVNSDTRDLPQPLSVNNVLSQVAGITDTRAPISDQATENPNITPSKENKPVNYIALFVLFALGLGALYYLARRRKAT